MTNTVLSPYLVFFIDEAEKLWTILKDGRTRLIKNVPAFSNVSTQQKYICGVEFCGEYTWIHQLNFDFSDNPPHQIMSVFGYCYYPTLLDDIHPKLALLKADLLNRAGTADLIVYQKARTKFHPQFKLSAQIIPPAWDCKTNLLYYVTANGVLARTNGKNGEKLASDVQLFCLNKTGTMVAYYDGEYIYQLSLTNGKIDKLTAFNVTALGYDTSDTLYFADTNGDTHGLNTYNVHKEICQITRTPHPIKIIV